MNGGIYQYYNVSGELYEQFRAAGSHQRPLVSSSAMTRRPRGASSSPAVPSSVHPVAPAWG
ncbi:hypothetical protein [Rhodoplanes roseus]|uniref:hypothetical protein n=1 Tax=Rhodoplanes roseus TaxID=29409 RepID=UPI003CCA84CF